MDLSTFAAGLGLGLSLIIAIGAQNLFVLRQGIRREHVLAVALTCAISDLVLILVGVSGVGAVLAAVPWLIDAVRWAGAAFLVGYGLLAARRAITPSGEALAVGAAEGRGSADASARAEAPVGVVTRRTTLAATLATCLALTWLNPHVYLDTVLLVGSIGAQHAPLQRLAFVAGAALASAGWFVALGYGARLLAPLFERPRAWQVLDAGIGLTMLALAAGLVTRALA